jgi:hypothetical protein
MSASNLTLALALRQSAMEYEDLEKKYNILQEKVRELKRKMRKLNTQLMI